MLFPLILPLFKLRDWLCDIPGWNRLESNHFEWENEHRNLRNQNIIDTAMCYISMLSLNELSFLSPEDRLRSQS
jgi:hypothetical protein